VALTVLDASVVIAFLDSSDRHHHDAVAAMDARRRSELVLPASVYAEVLVGPHRLGPAAVAKAEQAVAELGMRVEPLMAAMARRAAALRARHPALRLPDALVLATGELLDATAIVTADRAWPRFSRRARVNLTNYSGSMGELEPVDAGPGLGAPPGTAEKGASC